MIVAGAYVSEAARDGVAFSSGGAISPLAVLCAADFPGRWNPRRAIAPELAPLPAVVSAALRAARWWTPGASDGLSGALVLANDPVARECARRFSGDLRDVDGPVAPTAFLFSLPSTAAGVLGLLFGLLDYQATLVGRDSGLQALRHGLDLLALDRIERTVVASLERSPSGEPGAVALCIASRSSASDSCPISYELGAAAETAGAGGALLEVAKRAETWFCGASKRSVLALGGPTPWVRVRLGC